MTNKNNYSNKDVANSLSKYSELGNKSTNIILDSANQINKWYAEQLKKMTTVENISSRLETNIDDTTEELKDEKKQISSKIETKVDDYNELQTNNKADVNVLKNNNRIKTKLEQTDTEIEFSENNEEIIENIECQSITTNSKSSKLPKRITTAIRGTKFINNVTNKFIKIGKSINTASNEGSIKTFENDASRVMTKPLKKITRKTTNKATNIIKSNSKKIGKKVVQSTKNITVDAMKLVSRLVNEMAKIILSMLPTMTPIIIIIVIIVAFCSFFGIGMSEDTRNKYEQYMINTQNEYDNITVDFYNQGNIVDGAIEGRGMINWKVPLSIIQVLNGKLVYDNAEQELLNSFKNAELFEKVTDVTYTYEKEVEVTDKKGNTTIEKQIVTETKKVVSNPTLEDYIIWCNNNYSIINRYKMKKKLTYDSNQTKLTESEINQIKLLYSSNSFFELFSDNFKATYAYTSVNIGDEQLQAIYDEFLRNAGKRYFMDHSNLSYDNCMEYYDCSSWVIHCLAHTGIKVIPNTTASGIYNDYCVPINVNDRQVGDLIFLKDTYDTGNPGGISHVGIYMGELSINGEVTEWIIDTGGNPSGVRIRKYQDGWWNGSNFYGFGRLR